jgi:hypothetical protein
VKFIGHKENGEIIELVSDKNKTQKQNNKDLKQFIEDVGNGLDEEKMGGLFLAGAFGMAQVIEKIPKDVQDLYSAIPELMSMTD